LKAPKPILTSIYYAFRYHLGSIAFGAFILAVIWMIKLILAYIAKEVKRMRDNGMDSKVVVYAIKCLMCYVNCFEKVVKFISKLGFIQVAIGS